MPGRQGPDLAGFGDVGPIRATSRIGIILALAGAASYGLNIVAARLAQQAGLTGPDIVVYRALIFLPVVMAILFALKRRVTLTATERSSVFRFSIFAAGTALAYMSSLKFLPVPMAVTIFYTYPLLVILISPYTDGIRLSPQRWAVAIVAFVGVVLAVGPHIDALDPRGVALAFLGALFCAGMFVTAARLTTDGFVTFFWSQMVALPLALGFAWLTGGLSEPAAVAAAALPFGITALGFFLGLLLQILAAPRLSAASAGLLFLFEPVVAILTAALVLREHVTLVQATGMVLIIGALVYDVLPGLRSARRLSSGGL
jgi:drug/metabolite transporter (DMT)-like permease